MDRLKFRVYNKEIKKYNTITREQIIELSKIRTNKPDADFLEFIIASNGDLCAILNDGSIKAINVDTIDLIVEQCTGYKDRHHKMIYEGDIVKLFDLTDKEPYNIGIVKFISGGFKVTKSKRKFGWCDQYEIISNIYEGITNDTK